MRHPHHPAGLFPYSHKGRRGYCPMGVVMDSASPPGCPLTMQSRWWKGLSSAGSLLQVGQLTGGATTTFPSAPTLSPPVSYAEFLPALCRAMLPMIWSTLNWLPRKPSAHGRPLCSVSQGDRLWFRRPLPGSWLPKPSTTEFQIGRYTAIKTCSVRPIHTGSRTSQRQRKSLKLKLLTASTDVACSRSLLCRMGD